MTNLTHGHTSLAEFPLSYHNVNFRSLHNVNFLWCGKSLNWRAWHHQYFTTELAKILCVGENLWLVSCGMSCDYEYWEIWWCLLVDTIPLGHCYTFILNVLHHLPSLWWGDLLFALLGSRGFTFVWTVNWSNYFYSL